MACQGVANALRRLVTLSPPDSVQIGLIKARTLRLKARMFVPEVVVLVIHSSASSTTHHFATLAHCPTETYKQCMVDCECVFCTVLTNFTIGS